MSRATAAHDRGRVTPANEPKAAMATTTMTTTSEGSRPMDLSFQERLRVLCRQEHEASRQIVLNLMGDAAELVVKPYEMSAAVQKVMNRRNALDIYRAFGYRWDMLKQCFTYWLEDDVHTDLDLTRPIDADDLDVDLFNYIYVYYVLLKPTRKRKAMRTKETNVKRVCGVDDGRSSSSNCSSGVRMHERRTCLYVQSSE